MSIITAAGQERRPSWPETSAEVAARKAAMLRIADLHVREAETVIDNNSWHN